MNGQPGIKYPNLFCFYAFPMPGHTTEEMATGIHEEIQKLKTQDVIKVLTNEHVKRANEKQPIKAEQDNAKAFATDKVVRECSYCGGMEAQSRSCRHHSSGTGHRHQSAVPRSKPKRR